MATLRSGIGCAAPWNSLAGARVLALTSLPE
jgi:hypothetical protein